MVFRAQIFDSQYLRLGFEKKVKKSWSWILNVGHRVSTSLRFNHSIPLAHNQT